MKKSKLFKFVSVAAGASAAVIVIMLFLFSGGIPQAKAKPHWLFKDPPKPGVAAKIGDREITEDEVVGDSRVEYKDLVDREYELKMKGLEKITADIILGAEAKKAGMSVDDYVKKNITGKISVSDTELKKYIDETRIPKDHLTDEIKKRIRDHMIEVKSRDAINAALENLTKDHPVEVYFRRPRIHMPVGVGTGPAWGPVSATVTMIEFSEFHCPECSQWAPVIKELKKKYKDNLKIYFRTFLGQNPKDNADAVEAVKCLDGESKEVFWKFIDVLNDSDTHLTPKDLEKWAAKAGGDSKKLSECLSSHKFQTQALVDTDDGHHVGVRIAPSFFINGFLVDGNEEPAELVNLIESEMNRK